MKRSVDTLIFVPDYWPLYQTSERRNFHYTCPDGSEESFTSSYYFDPKKNSMVLENRNPEGKWLNTWYYRYHRGFGIAEWRDDHPLTDWRQKLFGDSDRHVFINPIGWGEYAKIGCRYQNRPIKNTFLCWPPMFSVGRQHVFFERHSPSLTTYHGHQYSDVLIFRYQQNIGQNKFGARYYNARGIGPIAIEWIYYRDDGSVLTRTRIDACVERLSASAQHDTSVEFKVPG